MTTHRSDIFSNHRVRFVARVDRNPSACRLVRPWHFAARARLPATIEGDAGAARSMETLLRARLDAQVARDRHRDRLRVIDADIRRAEEEGFAADAKVVSAREVLRRLERARDDARRRHAVLIARRKMANVTTRARSPSATRRSEPRGGARTFPIPDVRGGVSPTSFTSSRRRAGCETPAWNLRRLRASADATRLGAPRAARRAPTIPTPASPKSRNPPRRAASPGATSLRGSRREPSADDDGDRRLRDVARRPSRLRGRRGRWSREGQTPRQIGEGDVAHADGGVCDWRFGRRSSNCHRRRLIKPIKHIELS